MLVKIKLNTIRKNPRAGETVTQVPGPACYFVSVKIGKRERDRLMKLNLKDSKYWGEHGIIEIESIVGHGVNVVSEYCLKRCVSAEEFIKLRTNKKQQKDTDFRVERDVYRQYHQPEPKFLFAYEDKKVVCNECGWVGTSSKLVSMGEDDDGCSNRRCCPKCFHFVVTVEHEELSDEEMEKIVKGEKNDNKFRSMGKTS